MPILEKVCISLYLDIFQLTATAAAVSQEFSQSGKSPDPSRAGTKYPVQGVPHFDIHTKHLLCISCDVFVTNDINM